MNRLFSIVLVGIWTNLLLSQERYEFEYEKMGTQIRVVLYTHTQNKADSISNLVANRIDELNYILSDYIPDSELNALLKYYPKPVETSKDLYKVLKIADSISRETGGVFDITVGTIVDLWREARKAKTLPSVKKIDEARSNYGFKNISFISPNTVKLNSNKVKLDLGGIGKGYVADKLVSLLNSCGVKSALIDMGGDINVSNPPPNKDYWVLGFSFINEEGKEEIRKLSLKNEAVATSGDLYQYVEIDGVKYSHIINPLTGYALENRSQVTVVAKSGACADAFASAFSVWGVAKTREKMKNLKGLKVYIVENQGQKDFLQWNTNSIIN